MSSDPWVLGMSCSHNGSVCLLHGDEIVVAIQEERISRIKRHRIYGSQTSMALEYCFDYAGIQPGDLSLIVYSVQGRTRNPRHDLTLNPYLKVSLNGIPTLALPHHFSHAVSAFATSGFKDSAVIIIDGVGSPYEDLLEDERDTALERNENGWETISLYAASETKITSVEKHLTTEWLNMNSVGMPRFGSLGGMFSAAARQIFGDPMEAGKVMGLAPYGKPEIPAHEFFNIINGHFNFPGDVIKRFAHNDRWPMHKAEYQNLSCSTQVALEDALLYLARHIQELCPSDNLCYAGGVALNSVANERIIRESGFKNVYVMPAAEDSGPAIGAAYYGLWHLTNNNTRRKLVHDAMGRRYSPAAVTKAIKRAPAIELLDCSDVLSNTVDLLCEGKIVGWFHGRSELGPRALGQRSILCDPRREDAKDLLNGRVKHREAFRPFAPAVLLEEAHNWFELDGTDPDSPFMLRVCNFKKEKMGKVAAVVHIDGTGRVQTVTREANGLFYDLIKRFFEKTGVPILLNTSFNTMGEPIVETPEDALFCLLNTGLDYCVVEGNVVTKTRSLRSESITRLLGKVEKIKKRLNSLDPIPLPDVMEKINDRALEKIHRATVYALPEYENEVHQYLGCTPVDFRAEAIENFWREMLPDRAWENLDKETQECMITAGLAYCLLTKYPDRKKDWTAAGVEVLKAAEIELNKKLVAPFASWLCNQRASELDELLSGAGRATQDSWLQSLKRIRKSNGKLNGSMIPVGSICWAFSNAYGSEPQEQVLNPKSYQEQLLGLLSQFACCSKDQGRKEFFRLIGEQSAGINVARRESLSADFLDRNKVADLIERMQVLAVSLNEAGKMLRGQESSRPDLP